MLRNYIILFFGQIKISLIAHNLPLSSSSSFLYSVLYRKNERKAEKVTGVRASEGESWVTHTKHSNQNFAERKRIEREN